MFPKNRENCISTTSVCYSLDFAFKLDLWPAEGTALSVAKLETVLHNKPKNNRVSSVCILTLYYIILTLFFFITITSHSKHLIRSSVVTKSKDYYLKDVVSCGQEPG